ncbi:tyrosine--tRNA ligase [soil metagenome]|jgi:tyrosyl-tRNA synthetase
MQREVAPGGPVTDSDEALSMLESGAAQVLPEGGLAAKLATARREGRPLRVKLGIDPSGTQLTLGHAVVLRKLRQFQDLGHLAVLIVGDFTGQVGDPSGKTSTRAALSAEQTADNSAGYFAQLLRVLDPERVEVRRNSEWLSSMTMADVLRETRHLTVAQLLERDDFARRYSERLPISLTEFMYPLLQGYDSVAIRADIELGGTDQTYNNLVGRELQRAHGQDPQVVLTVPLLEGLDGVEKMGKSLGNWVGILEPPAEQYGKLMSIPDALVGRYARLCTALPPREVEDLERSAAGGGPPAGAAKHRLARAIVSLYHGEEAAERAAEAFAAIFRRRELPTDVPKHPLPASDPVHLPALLKQTGLATSTSEARRAIDEGAIRLDGVTLPKSTYDAARAAISGRVLQRGRRRAVRLGE